MTISMNVIVSEGLDRLSRYPRNRHVSGTAAPGVTDLGENPLTTESAEGHGNGRVYSMPKNLCDKRRHMESRKKIL